MSTATTADERLIQDVSYQLNFISSTFQNDVGYLVLSAPATLDAGTATVDIAGDDEAPLWAPGVLQDVSGWGSHGGGHHGRHPAGGERADRRRFDL